MIREGLRDIRASRMGWNPIKISVWTGASWAGAALKAALCVALTRTMTKAAMIPRSQRGGEKAIAGALRRVGQRSPAVRSSSRILDSVVARSEGVLGFELWIVGLMS